MITHISSSGEPDWALALQRADLASTVLASAGHAIFTVLLAVVGAVIANWIYARFFRARREFAADNKVIVIRKRADTKKHAARVRLTQPPIPWVGWLSDDVIDLPTNAEPGLYNTRFPGHDRAINTSMPYRTNEAEMVADRISFDLIGEHSTATPIARIRAVIDERRAVPAGTVYYAAPQGIISKQVITFDLGSPDLDTRVQDDEGTPTSRHFFDEHTVDVAGDESLGSSPWCSRRCTAVTFGTTSKSSSTRGRPYRSSTRSAPRFASSVTRAPRGAHTLPPAPSIAGGRTTQTTQFSDAGVRPRELAPS